MSLKFFRTLLYRSLGPTLCLTAALGQAAVHADGSALEQKVRAAFLYNFTKFISWPDSAFANGSSDLVLCVTPEGQFSQLLNQSLNGKMSGKRRITTRVVNDAQELAECQVLYIGEGTQTQPWLEASQRFPVLTVSRTEQFTDQGGIIQFVIEEGKSRFDINRAPADVIGLNISSKLLKIARNVQAKP